MKTLKVNVKLTNDSGHDLDTGLTKLEVKSHPRDGDGRYIHEHIHLITGASGTYGWESEKIENLPDEPSALDFDCSFELKFEDYKNQGKGVLSMNASVSEVWRESEIFIEVIIKGEESVEFKLADNEQMQNPKTQNARLWSRFHKR